MSHALQPLLAAGLLISALTACSPTGVVHGPDDRREASTLTEPRWVERAQATVGVLRRDQIVPAAEPSEPATLIPVPAPSEVDGYPFCADTPFLHQPQGVSATGVLVGPDLLLTAAHVIARFPGAPAPVPTSCEGTPALCDEIVAVCDQLAFAFDWVADPITGEAPLTLSPENIRHCARVEAYLPKRARPSGSSVEILGDLALIRLDRPVLGRPTVAISALVPTEIAIGTPVVSIGHSEGKPLKYSDDAAVVRATSQRLYVTTDTFVGNSGGPIFHAETGELLGLSAQGEVDYALRWDTDEPCWAPKVCDEDRPCARLESVATALPLRDLILSLLPQQ